MTRPGAKSGRPPPVMASARRKLKNYYTTPGVQPRMGDMLRWAMRRRYDFTIRTSGMTEQDQEAEFLTQAPLIKSSLVASTLKAF